jgi:hypothetical protein
MRTKVGSVAFADDPGRARRFAIAVPLAIVLTLLLVALGRWHQPARTPERVAVATVVLERAPPTPPPTPAPTPLPRVTAAPVPQRAGPAAVRAQTPARAPKAATAPKAPAPSSIAAAPGAGLGAAPGSGAADAGDTGDVGAGTGGTGTDAVNADAPCGYVDFIPEGPPSMRGSTSYETIRATVRFPDGHQESDDFPYPWIYPDAADTDPWSARNVRVANLTVHAQLPPSETDASRFSPVIRYILDHTRADGTTVLQECPKLR